MKYVTGKVNWILRLEGLILLGVMLALYNDLEFSWSIFAYLFFVPDLALLAYLVGANVGAVVYNTTHSTIGPGIVLLLSIMLNNMFGISIAFIWLAHIGFDRALGYGLKYSDGFAFTHLGVVGKEKI